MVELHLPPTLQAATYRLSTIMPAPAGWRAVYWDGLRHHVEAVHLLGLGTTSASSDPPVIVTFTYTPDTAWVCCDNRVDYCGLLAPGWDLASYEAQDPYGHVPQPGR